MSRDRVYVAKGETLHPSCHEGGRCCDNPCGPVYLHQDEEPPGISEAQVDDAAATEQPAGVTETRLDDQLFYIYPAGLMPGILLTGATIRKAMEAEERFRERRRNKNNKPPRPPRRPNARIGAIALSRA